MSHTQRIRCQRRAGFTLIELLVVIAIIAVLIGLLLPAVISYSIDPVIFSYLGNISNRNVISNDGNW